jgi:Flp pilus assembly protein TadG/uncharacterized protein YegL
MSLLYSVTTMENNTAFRKYIQKSINCKSGNFGILAALSLPLLFCFVGVAIDMSRLLDARSQLQTAADSAILATVHAMADHAMTDSQAQTMALKQFKAQIGLSNDLASAVDEKDVNIAASSTVVAGAASTYQISINASANIALTPMTSLLGFDHKAVSVTSVAKTSTESTKKPLSMYLVLDRSGSMADNTDQIDSQYTESYDCGYWQGNGKNKKWIAQTCTRTVTTYVTKIQALKNAAQQLFTSLNSADPDVKYVRTGAVSYNDKMQTPTGMQWGTTTASNYVNALTASGGTSSTNAFQTAYTALSSGAEETAHKNKNGGVPDKYIVFMTDGENNYASDDTATMKWCDSARTAGIQIYSIAFMAPAQGQRLLSYCATDSSHYFDVNSASQLSAAFKSIGAQATAKISRLTQ